MSLERSRPTGGAAIPADGPDLSLFNHIRYVYYKISSVASKGYFRSSINTIEPKSTDVLIRSFNLNLRSTEVAPEGTEVILRSSEVVTEDTEVILRSTEFLTEGTEVILRSTEVVTEGTEVPRLFLRVLR